MKVFGGHGQMDCQSLFILLCITHFNRWRLLCIHIIHYLKCIIIILQGKQQNLWCIHIHKIIPQIMSLIMRTMAVRTENNCEEANNMNTFISQNWIFLCEENLYINQSFLIKRLMQKWTTWTHLTMTNSGTFSCAENLYINK